MSRANGRCSGWRHREDVDNYDDDYEGEPCMWCGEPGCPGYDCNVEDYNVREYA